MTVSTRRAFLRLFGGGGLLAGLAACADSDSGRQFANDPIPTETAYGRLATSDPVDARGTASAAASPVSMTALAAGRSVASRIFLTTDDGVSVFDVAANTMTSIVRRPPASLIAIEPSPDGSSAAIYDQPDESGARIVVVDAGGVIHQTWSLGSGAGTATPSAGASSDPHGRVSWASGATRLLVAPVEGGLVVLPFHGEPETLVSPLSAPSIGAVAWSPGGTAIAFVSGGAAGDGLYVASISSLPLDPAAVVAPRTSQNDRLGRIEWFNGGPGLIYSSSATGGSPDLAGNVFSVQPTGGTPRLVASAGAASPVASIGAFTVTPDGLTIAFSAFIPAGSNSEFHSLWLQRIGSPSAVPVSGLNRGSLTDLWWTSSGLIARIVPEPGATSYRGGQFLLVRIDSDGSPRTIYSSSSSNSTPVASPVPGALATPAR